MLLFVQNDALTTTTTTMNLILAIVIAIIGCIFATKYYRKRKILKPDGAGCLLWWNDTVLLLERNPEYINNARKAHELEFPGGKYDPSKDAVPFFDTALREVREETGIELNTHQIQRAKVVKDRTPSNKETALFVVNLTLDQVLEVAKLKEKLQDDKKTAPKSRESQDMHWIPVQLLKNYVVDNNELALPYNLRPFNVPLIKKLFIENKL
jgi:8-oxo-dGTP pyrophosphatase MutT (NUDIX family)